MALRLTIAAIGRIKGAEKELFQSYLKRLSWPIRTIEVDARGQAAGAKRRAIESEKLAAAVPVGARIVALDEKGREFDSRGFARTLHEFELDGVQDLAFLIGGAEGHTKELIGNADLVLSFGQQTWPHMLVRVMLAEQLYRASTILSGHPYHRD